MISCITISKSWSGICRKNAAAKLEKSHSCLIGLLPNRKTKKLFSLRTKKNTKYQFMLFGLLWEQSLLHKNINTRVNEIIEKGLLHEVKSILDMGFVSEINALNTVGYKEIISYLKNEISLVQAVEYIDRSTRRFAKRQIT